MSDSDSDIVLGVPGPPGQAVDAADTDEAALHSRMHPRVAGVLKGKRILTFKRMLKHFGHVDKGVAADIASGVRLVGDIPSSGVFEPKTGDERVPGRPKQWLLEQAPGVRRSLKAGSKACSSREEHAIAVEVMRKTVAEVEKGLASGPHDEQQLTNLLGPRWVPSRRFGIQQGEKVRPIDGYSGSLVNEC